MKWWKKIKEKTFILDTPSVEGSIAVAVQTSISNNMEEINKVAEGARTTRKV
ncbi:Dihydroxyacetone kinase, phosphotransfer subunit (fragment) [[Clostridium] ultunense Esp]|uniref:Dihydroxyacetone kinase, phosphotransfer subunit n=1 Tax=[Clostridium] ultunense Esp TaxID=1288971 RepID=A0A1M4PQD6_9FIRM